MKQIKMPALVMLALATLLLLFAGANARPADAKKFAKNAVLDEIQAKGAKADINGIYWARTTWWQANSRYWLTARFKVVAWNIESDGGQIGGYYNVETRNKAGLQKVYEISSHVTIDIYAWSQDMPGRVSMDAAEAQGWDLTSMPEIAPHIKRFRFQKWLSLRNSSYVGERYFNIYYDNSNWVVLGITFKLEGYTKWSDGTKYHFARPPTKLLNIASNARNPKLRASQKPPTTTTTTVRSTTTTTVPSTTTTTVPSTTTTTTRSGGGWWGPLVPPIGYS